MDAAPLNPGLEMLTPPESVGSLIGFVNELTERTRLFEAESVPRTGLVEPFQGQILGEQIAAKYQVAVTTQIQWDRLRERYLVRAEDARDFTKWLVRWQQWRLNAMYGAEEPTAVAWREAQPWVPERETVAEQRAPAALVQQATRKPEPPTQEVPRGYKEFKDPVEQEQRIKAEQKAEAPPPASAPDYDGSVRDSLAKGNKAVWSANTAGGSAAAGYKTGAGDALAKPDLAQGMASPGSGFGAPGAGGARYRPPMTVVLQPGQTHIAQQNDFVMAMPGVQGAVQQSMPGPAGGGFGGALMSQLATRLPMGRLAGVAAAVAVPAIGSAFARPAAAIAQTVSPMASFAPAAPQVLAPQMDMAPRPSLEMAPANSFRPEQGMMTIFAPPLRVSSPAASAGGAAVEVPIGELAARSGPLDHASAAQLRATLPPGASLIYPAMPANELPPGAANLQLAPALLGDVLGRAYGPGAAAMAPALASQGISARGPAPLGPMQAALVPEGRPAGSGASILPQGNSGSGDLGMAGGGMASRGNALDFLGLPVRVAPSLGGRSELRDEIAAREGIRSQAQPQSARPDQFATLRQRMFSGQPSMNVEPDQAKWEQARPSFGMANASPVSVLSPMARVVPPTLTSSLPQSGAAASSGGRSASPMSTATSFRPMLARGSEPSGAGSSPRFSSPGMPSSGGMSSRSAPSSSGASGPAGSSSGVPRAVSPVMVSFPSAAPQQNEPTPGMMAHPLFRAETPAAAARPVVSSLPAIASAAGGPRAVPISPPSFSMPVASGQDGLSEATISRSGAGPSMTARTSGSPTGGGGKSPMRPPSPVSNSGAGPMLPMLRMPPPTTGMPMHRRPIAGPSPQGGAIQFSRPGSDSGSSSSSSPSQSSSRAPAKHGNTGGGPAQEVDMLAREVYSLIRRRLSVEAERRGR